MDWSHLKVVLAIARGGSLTAAARLLKIDQTTAGRHLNALEADIRTPLFLRAKSGFVPTEAGQVVLETARRVEMRLDAMEEALADPQVGARGVVRLVGNTWMLKRLAEHALRPLMAEHAALEIRMSGRLPPVPLHGEPTIGLWFDAAAQATDRTHPLARVPYSAYRSAATPPSPDDWVVFRDDDAEGPSFTRQVSRRLGADARIRMTATDAEILLGAVRSGIGTGILPRCLGNADPDLAEDSSSVGQINRVLNMHVARDVAQIRRVRIVTDWLRRAVVTALDAKTL